MAKFKAVEVEALRKLRRNLRNAERVLRELAKTKENVDVTNVYWLAKQNDWPVR